MVYIRLFLLLLSRGIIIIKGCASTFAPVNRLTIQPHGRWKMLEGYGYVKRYRGRTSASVQRCLTNVHHRMGYPKLRGRCSRHPERSRSNGWCRSSF